MKDERNIPTELVESYRGDDGAVPGLVGTTLDGRFRVLRRLAGGATGQVYEALQAPFDRRVAVKVLDVDASADPTFRARFQREASLAARVAHPNIVTIYDYGETPDGQVYMVMELLRGRSLARVLRDEGRLHPSHALDIALQMTRALRRAHQHGIVHRDLKPANVVLEPSEDASDLVKVLDFGLVKLLEPGRGSDPGVGERLTAVGAMLGTPGYMSPEQAMGEEVDARTDVYACGVILYELLAGAKPFPGPTVQDVLSKQVMQPVPPLYGLDSSAETAEAIERLIRDCLHPNRAHRPASAEVLLASLKEVWRLESDTSYGTEASFVGLRPQPSRVEEEGLQAQSLEVVLNEELGPPQITLEEPRARGGAVLVAILGLIAGLLFALAGVVLWSGPPEGPVPGAPPAPPAPVTLEPVPVPSVEAAAQKTKTKGALQPLPETLPEPSKPLDEYKANPY